MMMTEPSAGCRPTTLRKWHDHDPARRKGFRERYFSELNANPEGVQELIGHLGTATTTFLYGSKEHERNNAAALRDYLETMLKRPMQKEKASV